MRQLPGGEQWEKTQKKLVPVPGSGEPPSHAQQAVLVQGQASVTGTGHLMPHYPDEAVTVAAVKGPAWPEPDIYSHSIISYHNQDSYNHVTRKKKCPEKPDQGAARAARVHQNRYLQDSRPALLNVLPPEVLNPQRSDRKSIPRHSQLPVRRRNSAHIFESL